MKTLLGVGLLRWMAIAAFSLASGCSSSSTGTLSQEEQDCTMFSACGGDIVGTWTVTNACYGGGVNPFAAQCPSSTDQIAVTSASGTMTFNADGTYSTTFDVNMTMDFTLPTAACLNGATCAQIQASFVQSDGGTGSTVATCTDAASGGCNCHLTSTSDAPKNGHYAVSGSTIMLDGQAASYCVEGSGLLLQGQNHGTAGGTLTFTATKQ
jgi:hypothetical protein